MPQYLWSLGEIAEAVANYYSIPLEALKNNNFRASKVTDARHVAQYLSRKLSFQSMTSIARFYGQKQTGSVCFAWNKISTRMTKDPVTRAEITGIINQLEASAKKQLAKTG